jgi:arylsulfatase A-like enzyme
MLKKNNLQYTNVVIVLSDDQGWGDLSFTGNTQISTPRINRMAEQGALMEHFYVQPLCAPTRAEILTGREYPRTGVKGVSRCAERLNLDETTIADIFKLAGYATGCFGKWHSGMQYPYHPNGRGFDEFFGYCCGHWSHYFDSTVEHNGVEIKTKGYLTDVLTSKAIEFIEEKKSEPFLCYIPLNTPHSPFQVPDRWFDKFKDMDLSLHGTEADKEIPDATRSALAMCENIDWNVGRVLDTLDKLELSENTIVIYLSDNGPNGNRWNGGMKGIKGSHNEGGVRSPCTIQWKGKIQEDTVISEISSAIDLLPTLCDMVEIPLETKYPLNGRSLKPLLLQESDKEWGDRGIFALRPMGNMAVEYGNASIRTQKSRAYEDGSFYELNNDIGEEHDLSSTMPDESLKLKETLKKWKESLPPLKVDAVLPLGYPEFKYTYLPAQDASPSGNVTWSCIHPNCSWFHNWTSTDDLMAWDIEVATTGSYKATLMYACPAKDLGATVELSFGDESCSARIEKAFDPAPKTGFDRVPRREEYDKEFAPLELGIIELPAGRGQLKLKALEVPGGQVCEVRTVRLELI